MTEGSTLHDVIDKFRHVGYEGILRGVGDLNDFDAYILRYFYDGIAYANENLSKT